MEVRKYSPRLLFVSFCLIFLASPGSISLAHEEDESCDEACKAARYEKYKQWKAEKSAAEESDKKADEPAVDDKGSGGHEEDPKDDHEDDDKDHDGKWTEEERAAWREKWKNFDYSKYKSTHGDPGHVCRRGAKKARAQIDQIDKTTTNLVKDQLDAVAEARVSAANTSDISGAAPVERAAFAVKMRRDIDRIEDKIVKGRPVSRREIAKIPNQNVREKLMKALHAQAKVDSLEEEREQTLNAMNALEKMADATAKAEVDMSSLQKAFIGKEKRSESGKPIQVANKSGQSNGSYSPAASPGESDLGERFSEAQPSRAQAPHSRLREALRQRMLARGKTDELDTEIIFNGSLNRTPPKDDYVAFTGEMPKKVINPDLIGLEAFQPIKTGKALAGPETEAEVKRISMEVALPEIAPVQNRAPASEASVEEPLYLDPAILSRHSLSLFERVKHYHEDCVRKKCVTGLGRRG